MSKRNKLPPIKSGSKQKLSTSDSNKYLVSANSMEMVERNSKKHNDANLTPTAQGRHWAHHFHDDTLPDEDELKRCNSLFDNDEVEFVNDITPWKAYYTTQGFVAYYNENTQGKFVMRFFISCFFCLRLTNILCFIRPYCRKYLGRARDWIHLVRQIRGGGS